MHFRVNAALATLALAVSLLAAPGASLAEGRYQTEVGPPVVVLDTETGAVWVGEQDPIEGLVLKRLRYEDDDGTLHDLPPEE